MRGLGRLLFSTCTSTTSSCSTLLWGRIKPWRLPSPLRSLLQNGERTCELKNRSLSCTADMLLDYESDQSFDDGKAMDKDASLNLAISQLAGDFDRESNLCLNRFSSSARYTPVISTGSLKLDLALGIGGLPKGRIVEIYGREASGKTTLALHIVKEAQKIGGYCAYIDAENALNPVLAEAMGINAEDLLIAQPDCAENLLSIVNELVNSGSIDVIIVDSVAALVSRDELDNVIGTKSEEKQSQLMTRALRKIHRSLSRSQTLVIFINQVRKNLRSSCDVGEFSQITCGGNALAFYAAVRMRIMRMGLLRHNDEITGIRIGVHVIKNKLAPAVKKAVLDVGFGRGFLYETEILDMASTHGIILREGIGYWIQGQFMKNHLEALQFLTANNDITDEIVSALRSQYFEMRGNDG